MVRLGAYLSPLNFSFAMESVVAGFSLSHLQKGFCVLSLLIIIFSKLFSLTFFTFYLLSTVSSTSFIR